jgi:hypothetical protein
MEQVTSGTYDFIANKALLKLYVWTRAQAARVLAPTSHAGLTCAIVLCGRYGFSPAKRNNHITALILTKVLMALEAVLSGIVAFTLRFLVLGACPVKALMNLPSTDMMQCLYLLTDDVRAKEPVRACSWRVRCLFLCPSVGFALLFSARLARSCGIGNAHSPTCLPLVHASGAVLGVPRHGKVRRVLGGMHPALPICPFTSEHGGMPDRLPIRVSGPHHRWQI